MSTKKASETLESVRLSILLPVREEFINLKIMVRILGAVLNDPHEILVIYDDPQDPSRLAVDEVRESYPSVKGLLNTYGPGVINAISYAVEKAKGEYVLIFAADELGPVVAIDDMLALMEEGCDLVSCTRYAHGGRRLGGSLVSRVLSRIANQLFRLLTPCVLSDCTTGIKLFRRADFSRFALRAAPVGWAFAFEMAIRAHALHFSLGEVPIISIDRFYGGRSTFRPLPWIREYTKWFLWGLRVLNTNPNERPRLKVRIPLTLQK